MPTASSSLSASVGPLIGRRREVAQVRELLEEARLVTITGAGGSGKTRVALAVVDGLEAEAVVVQLAAIGDPGLVAAAIAQELGLGGTSAEEAIVESLGPRRLVLCLDNFEHVVEAAPLLVRLLAAAPALRILVTSRTTLRLTGEHEFSLAPFDGREAVEFFTACARRFQPSFEPDAAVIEICRRLDGLPLALELAAARAKLLSPAQILDRLERRLPLLSGGRRDVPERHRTLQAAIDWSYQLLTLGEQRLFARLSIFPGGCTLDEAEAVGDEGADTFEHLASLLDKSLLRRQDADEPRFRMLETLRVYAGERLEEEGGVVETRARQVAYYVRLAETSEIEMVSGRYAQWMARLGAELDNLESLLFWGFEQDPEPALRILGAAGSRIFHLAPARVGAWLDRALAVRGDPGVSPSVAARVATTAGYVRLVVRDLEVAEAGLAGAVEEWTRLGNRGEIGRARALLGSAYAYTGRPDDAREQARLALAEARAAGDERILMMVLSNVGSTLSIVDDFDGARAVLEEVIPLAEERGASSFLFVGRVNLGSVLLRQDATRAAEVFRAALAQTDIADTQLLHAREGIALATLLAGDAEGARQAFAAYIGTARETGRKGEIQAAVGGLMGVASANGDADLAARLAGARAAVAPGVKLPSYLERFAETARGALGEDKWLRLVAEGAAMPLDDVLAPVLGEGGDDAVTVRRAFVFTDIVSSTQLLELIGDAAWGHLLSWHDRTLRALFATHGGDEVDHAGDGFFVSFPHAREAVECAVAIQGTLAEHSRAQGFSPAVRIGIHETEAEHVGDRYRGLGVHTAARIAAVATGGEIVASAATAAAAAAATIGDIRTLELKGVAEPVTVVSLAWREGSSL